jgi:hypothetical protein
VDSGGGECGDHCLCGCAWVSVQGACQSGAGAGGGYFPAGGDRVSDGVDFVGGTTSGAILHGDGSSYTGTKDFSGVMLLVGTGCDGGESGPDGVGVESQDLAHLDSLPHVFSGV